MIFIRETLIIPFYSKFCNFPKILKPLCINVIFKFQSCLKNILINNTPKNDCNIVYKIPCTDCNGIYLGQTSKTLQKRVQQHKSYVRRFNKNSALFMHSFQQDHSINWIGSCKILNINDWFERNVIESFLIDFNKNNFNLSGGLCSFDPIMTKLLKIDLTPLLNRIED